MYKEKLGIQGVGLKFGSYDTEPFEYENILR